MSSQRLELAFIVIIAAVICTSIAADVELQHAVELNALRMHKHLIAEEMARLYLMPPMGPEVPLMLHELQQRQLDVQMQIDALEQQQVLPSLKGNSDNGAAPSELHGGLEELNLTADFEQLQRKLNELKEQMRLMALRLSTKNSLMAVKTTKAPTPGRNVTNGKLQWTGNNFKRTEDKQQQKEQQSPEPTAGIALPTAEQQTALLWTPVLTLPELAPESQAVTTEESSTSTGATVPSLLKRLLTILRPNSAASNSGSASNLRSSRPDGQPVRLRSSDTHLWSVEELLPHLQKQRQFLDQAIRRLERLVAPKNATAAKLAST